MLIKQFYNAEKGNMQAAQRVSAAVRSSRCQQDSNCSLTRSDGENGHLTLRLNRKTAIKT